MWVLIIVFFVGALVLGLITYFNRRNKNEEIVINDHIDEECCGAHEVCDKDSLLSSGGIPEYYEDEELDTLACIPESDYSESQRNSISEVFYTLKETEVAGWLRSLQLRRIELPADIKEQALLIVSERRTV